MDKRSHIESAGRGLDLSVLPAIHVLPAHFDDEERCSVEETLIECGAPLTYAISEAKIFLSKVERKRRAALELRSHGLWTEEIATKENAHQSTKVYAEERKRKYEETEEAKTVTDDSSTESEPGTPGGPPRNVAPASSTSMSDSHDYLEANFGGMIKVARLSWLHDCVRSRKIFPLSDYIIYEARPIIRALISSKPLHGSKRKSEQSSKVYWSSSN